MKNRVVYKTRDMFQTRQQSKTVAEDCPCQLQTCVFRLFLGGNEQLTLFSAPQHEVYRTRRAPAANSRLTILCLGARRTALRLLRTLNEVIACRFRDPSSLVFARGNRRPCVYKTEGIRVSPEQQRSVSAIFRTHSLPSENSNDNDEEYLIRQER